MKTLEIRTNSIKVQDNNGMTLLVAKYQDENGVYFFNENLQKQYAVVEAPKVKVRTTSANEYRFYVEYEHSRRPNNIDSTICVVKANSPAEALEKATKRFKNIYDISTL